MSEAAAAAAAEQPPPAAPGQHGASQSVADADSSPQPQECAGSRDEAKGGEEEETLPADIDLEKELESMIDEYAEHEAASAAGASPALPQAATATAAQLGEPPCAGEAPLATATAPQAEAGGTDESKEAPLAGSVGGAAAAVPPEMGGAAAAPAQLPLKPVIHPQRLRWRPLRLQHLALQQVSRCCLQWRLLPLLLALGMQLPLSRAS